MKRRFSGARKGQVLIIVALGILALAAMVALAVDVGGVYTERRNMQNAADAGALAGARDLCFDSGTVTSATIEAQDYAVNRNGADIAGVNVDGMTVRVAVTKTVDTYFAGLIGFPAIDVTADAAAMCSAAVQGGGIWPLAVRIDAYDRVDCNEAFYAFVAKSNEGNGQDDGEGTTDVAPIDCNYCECDLKLPGPGGEIAQSIAPGERGWLRLFPPPSSFPDPCPNHNCGADEMKCWLEYGHPGPIQIGDCIPGKPGVTSSGKKIVDDLGKEHAIFNLVLFDRECNGDDPDPLGTCPVSGASYHVAGFGCVEIIEWAKVSFNQKPGTQKECPKNVDVVIVRKRCGDVCQSATGIGGGGYPAPDDTRAVSLID